jgi:prepilin-type N-terminal cleavage/methylation domain-containing protein
MKKRNGFTLIEVMAVVFIVGLMSVILVVNWRKNENRYQLQRTAQEIAQLIRKAQNLALVGKQMYWPPSGLSIIPNSYGVHFEKQSPTLYFIYGDHIGNDGYQSPEDIPETYTWTESGIEISSVGGGNTLDLFFNIPDGDIGFFPNGSSATITIRRVGKTCPSNCKDITITSTGQISIQ